VKKPPALPGENNLLERIEYMRYDNFLALIDTLLGEDGCPWDREQTHDSLRPYLLEECYETIEAINSGDMSALKEELGDVFLQVIFHAKLAEKAGAFTIDDVIAGVTQKLVSRHTHVFGTDEAKSPAEVLQVWEANKKKEQPRSTVQAMEAVPKALPALVRASKVLKRSGQETPDIKALCKDIYANLKSLTEPEANAFEIYGNIMLQMVNLSAFLGVNAEFSLTNAVEGFINTNSAENPAPSGL